MHFERRRTHSAAHVGGILSGGDDSARSIHMVGHRPTGNASTAGSDRTSPLLGRSGQDVGQQLGRARALVIWAAAVDPADVPMIRSASVTSNPASNRPAMTPINHALPTDPPPPRTNAHSPAARTRLMASTCS